MAQGSQGRHEAHQGDTLPDWSGRWEGGPQGLGGGHNPASYVASLLTPKYREYFVQEMRAVSEGRTWGAGSFCLPGGFIASLGAEEFIVLRRQGLDARREQRSELHPLDLHRRQPAQPRSSSAFPSGTANRSASGTAIR